MRVLVTGGGGFIGSHLTDRLLAQGHEVVVLDNFSTGRRENLAAAIPHVELVEGDIRSYERVHTATRGCEAVFHQGALPSVPRSVQDPLTSVETNVTGTLNVLLSARDAGVRRVIMASSSSVYGASPELPKREDQRTMPVSPYSVSKLTGEGFCRSFSEVWGLDTVALRYFNVFGPRQDPLSQYAAVIPNFIAALGAGERPVIFGDGEQSRDFTYIDNVIEANVLALARESTEHGIYNIACGTRATLNELVARIADVLGVEAWADHVEPRAGDVRHSLADILAAERDLGYRPLIDLAEGLRRTVGFFTSAPAAGAAGAMSMR